MPETKSPQRQYNVLVFGLERKGLPEPTEPLLTQNFSVSFERYGTDRRFNEYDGVIIFQGIFEEFDYRNSYLKHAYDVDELDKRKKEAALLLGKGGFLCFLLTDSFIDHDERRDFSATDLTKYHLNYSKFYRKNFKDRIAHITPIVDEFKRFMELFGGANSYFEHYNDSLDFRVLAKVNDRNVGALINRNEYFIPSLIPDARPKVISEYFCTLIDAITSVHNKLHQTIPDWVAAYQFHEEAALLQDQATFLSKVSVIDSRLEQLSRFKAALLHSGPELVSDISAILEAALGTKIDAIDDFREDLKLLGEDGKIVCVCEVKGINRGIKRENINQTDSHRERSGFDNQFPALLIANTNIKSARSIVEKDQEIAQDQVVHAVRMNILIMRSLDLIGLLRLVLAGELTQHDALSLVLSNTGWLRVQADNFQVIKGE